MSTHVITAFLLMLSKLNVWSYCYCSRRALFEELHACVFYIGNKPIESVNSFHHLGHFIYSELRDDEDITKSRNNVIDQVNNTLSYFRYLDSLVHHKLFQSYCTSYYGCELLLLSNPKYEALAYVLLGERACGKYGKSLSRRIAFCYI